MQAKINEYGNTIQRTEGEGAFQGTEIGSIPQDWKVVRLGDVCKKVKAGGTPSRGQESYWNGDIPFLLIEDMSATEKYLRHTKSSITKKGLENSSSWIVPPNSIILSLYGTVGKAVINEIPISITQNMAGIIPNEQKVYTDFLYYALENSKKYLWTVIDISVHKHITTTKAKQIPIPLPSLPEQQRIAKVLGTIQRAIEQQNKIIEAAKNLKKSLMEKLFTEGRYGEEQKETEIGFIPKSWTAAPLEANAEFQYGYTATAVEGDIGPRFLRITDIGDNGKIIWEKVPHCEIDEEEVQKYRLVDGDILVARIGATTGKTCMIQEAPKAVFGSYLIRILVDKEKCCPEYVYYFTNTSLYWSQINANKEGKLKKGVSASFLKTLIIPLPPLPEQQEIARLLRSVDKKIDLEQRTKKTLQELFKTMLHKLMTGEIRLKDVEV